MSSDAKQLGGLSLGLLVLMVILATVFIVGGQFLESTCVDIDGGDYSEGNCRVSATNTNESESLAFNATEDVITAIQLVVSFLTIIVLILIAKILVSNARDMARE